MVRLERRVFQVGRLCYQRDLALLKGNDNPYRDRDSLSRRGLKLVKRKGGTENAIKVANQILPLGIIIAPHRVRVVYTSGFSEFVPCRTLSPGNVSRSILGYIIRVLL